MSTLYTVTANLLAETTAWYSTTTWGKTQRAERETFQVGGKGINVTRMAGRVGRDSEAYCFPAGRTGDRCVEWLRSQGMLVRSFAMPGETRSGWVVRAEGVEETTFLGMDRPLHPGSWREALVDLGNKIEPDDALALCGSIPGWGPELLELWQGLVSRLHDHALIGVDSYGPALRDLMRVPVHLVKINRHEWQTLVGSSRELNADSLRAVADRYPSREWVITDGVDLTWALDREGAVFSIRPPVVKQVSATGCGDVTMAVLMDGLMRKMSLRDALLRAIPWAAANAARPGLADMEESDLPQMAADALREYK
jgi:1-phosphofructokinase